MSYDILSTLREMEPTFSKGQKRIARYITEDYDKAAFMTANRLGKTVGVSESTVVRFAVDLGFDGYPSMQKAMQEMVLNRLTSVQRIEVANDRLGDQDVVSTVLRSDMEKIRQTAMWSSPFPSPGIPPPRPRVRNTAVLPGRRSSALRTASCPP